MWCFIHICISNFLFSCFLSYEHPSILFFFSFPIFICFLYLSFYIFSSIVTSSYILYVSFVGGFLSFFFHMSRFFIFFLISSFIWTWYISSFSFFLLLILDLVLWWRCSGCRRPVPHYFFSQRAHLENIRICESIWCCS